MCLVGDKSAEEMTSLVNELPLLYKEMYPNGVKFHNPPIIKTNENGFIINALDLIQWLKETKCSFVINHKGVDVKLYWSPNIQNQIRIRYFGHQHGPGFEILEKFISECSLIK